MLLNVYNQMGWNKKQIHRKVWWGTCHGCSGSYNYHKQHSNPVTYKFPSNECLPISPYQSCGIAFNACKVKSTSSWTNQPITQVLISITYFLVCLFLKIFHILCNNWTREYMIYPKHPINLNWVNRWFNSRPTSNKKV
jgi:hypothetical protein